MVKTHLVSARVDNATHEKLTRIAEAQEHSVSQLIRLKVRELTRDYDAQRPSA